MATWHCVKQCGACCYLDPAERPDLDQYLSTAEFAQYISMVGEDGWCVHFNPISRACNIYADRPRFCRVEPDVFRDLYQIEPDQLEAFAIECCCQQIEGVYGDPSPEMERFTQTVGI